MAAKQRLSPPAKSMAPSPAKIDMIGEDLLENILCRLPAASCASAACVNHIWNLIITRLFTVPNLPSALSCHPCLQDAVAEVVDKVLARPIRPQFVIASISPSFDLEEAHCLIVDRFSSQIPVITSISCGIFGQDASTNEFKEVQWDTLEDDEDCNDLDDEDPGVLITVGSLPGLAVDLIPLKKTQGGVMTKDFVRSIRERSFSHSGSSPMGILLFSATDIDIRPILAKLDYAFSSGTAIVGDAGSKFLYQGGTAINHSDNKASSSAAVALLFSRDIGKPPGVGETQFHVMLSTGISPVGPTYEAVYAKWNSLENSTQLMAKTEAIRNMNGEEILDQIYDELGDHAFSQTLYIGVKRMRKCNFQPEDTRWITMHEFQQVLRNDEDDSFYLHVHGDGIRSRNSFRFYHADYEFACASNNSVSNNMKRLKQDLNHLTDDYTSSNGSIAMDKKSVFGGMMFACFGRGKLFFGEPNVDASPFLENFPGVTFSGTFCNGEIAHGDFNSFEQESKERGSVRCSLHELSTVFLVMSYTPGLPQH